jgi:rare lipoprotein A
MICYSPKTTAAIVAVASLLSMLITSRAEASSSAVAVDSNFITVQLNGGDSDRSLLASDTAAPANTSEAKSAAQADKQPAAKPAGKTFSGNVSWYGPQFQGKKTASGRPFDMNKLTCAHRNLPFGTKILVENPRTGQSVIVEVIDRGPYAGHRVMDLSREAARRLGIILGGLAFVQCTVISQVAK